MTTRFTSMRFGIISDPHLAPADVEPYIWHNTVDLPHSAELLEAGLAWLRTQAMDTVVLLGDLTESADRHSFDEVRARVAKLGVPVLALPGNCDVDPVDRSTSAFQQIGGSNLTVAPALRPTGAGCAIELIGVAGEPHTEALRGVRVAEQPDALERVRIVFTHYPVLDVRPELSTAGYKHSGNLIDRAELEVSLRKSGTPAVVIHGHLHVHDARVSESLLHLSCAALVEPPHHVSTIEIAIDDDRLEVERQVQVVREDPVERVPVFAPSRQRWTWNGCSWGTLPTLP
jgi:predicted phosphodiesterase